MVQANEIYRHFKGNLYKVICIARDSETLEDMVVYQALYGNYDIYVRPLDNFESKVDINKYPEVSQSNRFELVSPVANLSPQFSAPEVTPIQAPAKVSEEERTSCSKEDDVRPSESMTLLKPGVEEFLDADNVIDKVNILENIMGPPGLTAILFFVAVAFLTYLTTETITVIRKATPFMKNLYLYFLFR